MLRAHGPTELNLHTRGVPSVFGRICRVLLIRVLLHEVLQGLYKEGCVGCRYPQAKALTFSRCLWRRILRTTADS